MYSNVIETQDLTKRYGRTEAVRNLNLKVAEGCITGFLGALTTFSTFSAESVQLLQASRYGAAALHCATHLFGSIVATIAGFATWRALT